MYTISNSDDVIDSRDVIKRIEELEAEISDIEEEEGFDSLKAKQDHAEIYDELANLKALAEDGEGCDDWNYGVCLIRDSYFKTYAQEYADDNGAVPDGLTWPCRCIDWDQAARELQMDYTSVEFDGVTYWVR